MISKVASLRSQVKAFSRILAASTKNHFSTVPPSEGQPAGQQDSASGYVEEWQKVYEQRTASQQAELEQHLTPNQKKRLDLLSQALLEMDKEEVKYFTTLVRDRIFKSSGINPLKLNVDWPTLKQLDVGSWPPANSEALLQSETMAKLWPAGKEGFSQLFGGAGMGGAPQAQSQAAAAPKVEEKVEEKPQEKSKFDIELSGIDATKKIAIIKEVRELLKLGLKEAKEMVEKAPVVLKRDVKKEEAEQLKEKLGALGCSVNLL